MAIKNIKRTEFGTEGILYFPIFDTEVSVYFDEDISKDYLRRFEEYLINMSDKVINSLCESSIRYCESMRGFFEDMGVYIPENIESREILNYMFPKCMSIEKPENENIIAFEIELSCDWAPKQGMEWIIRDDKVLYVGGFEGESEWYEEQHFRNLDWNYVNFNN